MGYGGSLRDAGAALGRTGDEGIDGIIKEDRLGLDVVYVQTKRWASTVGRPEIQKFAGALQAQFMFDHNVGVTPVSHDEVKQIDTDFFESE